MPVYCIKLKENLLFFSVNTKYISSRELKTSKFSRVLRTRRNSDVFNSVDEIYLVFTSKKQISSIYLKGLYISGTCYLMYALKHAKAKNAYFLLSGNIKLTFFVFVCFNAYIRKNTSVKYIPPCCLPSNREC